MNTRLGDIFSEFQIVTDLRAANQWEAIDELVETLAGTGKIEDGHQGAIVEAVRKREQSMSTGIGIPHASTRFISNVVAALGRSKAGINFAALDGQLVNLVMLFLVPQGQFQKHLHIVAELAKFLKNPALRQALQQAPDAAAMLHIIRSPSMQGFLHQMPKPTPAS
jgi:mannitol/fructose-specific phosphotransferase system IIA component (Ntr-type)